MNGKRCAIFLGIIKLGGPVYPIDTNYFVSSRYGITCYWPRIYGSHSEAKRELKKWLQEWPNAKIVEEGDL